MPIYRHLKKEKSKRNICSLNSSSKHDWKKWRMKEGDSFPLVADKATWGWTPSRSRGTPWWVEEKLDRGLASESWHDIFPATYITNEDASPSNHSTIILCTEGSTTRMRYRFRFENAWLCDDDCTALIL